MSKELIILHYSPVEYYPPVLNLIDILDKERGLKVTVISTHHFVEQLKVKSNTKNINIYRLPYPKPKDNKVTRIIKYLLYYSFSFYFLLKKRPETLLYYESISALPALLYKRIKGRSNIYAHYHEYTSDQQYMQEMVLVRLIHNLEKRLYNDFTWISHTNAHRLVQFAKECRILKSNILHELPNYPSRKWLENSRRVSTDPFKLVYVGSLDLENMYFENICEWVEKQDGRITLDVYAYNYKEEVIAYVNRLKPKFIRLYDGIDYYSIPSKLSNYNAGLILYRGHTFNYIYNAPNKLFEYLVCGLDVWFPEELKGSYNYINESSLPKVMKLNFNSLDSLDTQELINRNGLLFKEACYTAEEVYFELINSITRNNI